MVSDPLNPNNYLIYIANHDLGNCIMSIDDDIDVCIEESCIVKETEKEEKINKNVYSSGVWKMFFDGASSCEGAGARVLFVAHDDEFIILFFL
jgi:hypothetical protein